MSLPPHPPSAGTPGAYGPEVVVWGPPPTPSWMPPWQPAAGPSPAGPGVPPPGQRPRTAVDRPLVMVLVALASLLVGAVGAGVAVTLFFFAGAEDMSRALGAQLAPSEDPLTGGGTGYGPVDEFPAVAPGVLGDDAVLDAHAADCFDGDLHACDSLYFESPPMSDYEEYALTCGGRVKAWAVVSCTELD